MNKLFKRDFTMVVIGQIISLFGSAILRFALPLYLLRETDSSSLFGAVTACAFIPMVFCSLFGGVIADRKNKRNIMVTLDFINRGGNFDIQLCTGKIFACTLDDCCADDTVRHFGDLSACRSVKHTTYYGKTVSYAGQRSDQYGKHTCEPAGSDNRRRTVRRAWDNAHTVYKHRLLYFSAVMELFIHIP